MTSPRRYVWGMVCVALVACEDPPEPRRVPDAPVDAGPSLLTSRGYEPGIEKLLRGFESVHALKLVVHPDRMVLQARDPAKPAHVDQYVFRDGARLDPVPVKLKGKGTLEDNLFPLDEVKLEAVPDLVERALATAEVEEGKVTKVLVKRALPKKRDIQFRIFVSGPRRDVVLVADEAGDLLEGEE